MVEVGPRPPPLSPATEAMYTPEPVVGAGDPLHKILGRSLEPSSRSAAMMAVVIMAATRRWRPPVLSLAICVVTIIAPLPVSIVSVAIPAIAGMSVPTLTDQATVSNGLSLCRRLRG